MATSIRTPITGRRAALAPLLIAAGVVLVTDLATKQWALQHLAGIDLPVAGRLHLTIVHNDGLAWGMHAGGFGLQITAVLTVALVALVGQVCEPLMAIDALAPLALGLLLGAGAANLLDALIAPAGVVDFIAYTRASGDTSVLNVADLFAAVGFVLLARTAFCLLLAMRESALETRTAPLSVPRAVRPVHLVPTLARPRLIVSLGHAFAAMCAFVWLYSLAIVWTPDAGRTAPSTMLCAVAVFAASFVASQGWSWLTARRQLSIDPAVAEAASPRLEIVVDRERVRDFERPTSRVRRRPAAAAGERVVLDGSLAVSPMPEDGATSRTGLSPLTRDERDREVRSE